jgi:hypothetical protein
MSPYPNGSSSSSSNKGGICNNDGGYFSSGDVNFGSGGSGHMSSFSDINNNKSIKSSMHAGGGSVPFGCGSTLPTSLSINGGTIGMSLAPDERKKSQFYKK